MQGNRNLAQNYSIKTGPIDLIFIDTANRIIPSVLNLLVMYLRMKVLLMITLQVIINKSTD